MQTLADPLPPSVLDQDGKLQPRWKPRTIGLNPNQPVEFFSREELKGAWCLGGSKDLKFTEVET